MAATNVSTSSIFRSIDWFSILLYLLLVTMGWFSIVGATHNYGDPDIVDFSTRAGKQLLWIGLSMVLAFVLLFTDDRIYSTFANVFYAAMILLLLVTPFVATNHKGSYSWIDLGPVSLQPAEFAKTVTALMLAKTMGAYGFSLHNPRNAVKAAAILAIPIACIILQRETGSALVLIAFMLMFYREGMSGSILFVAFAAVVYFVVGLRFQFVLFPSSLSSVGETVVLLLIWLFSVILLLIYCRDKIHAKRMFYWGVMAHVIMWLVSNYVCQYDTAVAQAVFCGGVVVYLLWQSLRQRLVRLSLIAGFVVGSVAMYYSIDYVYNHIMQPHQRGRIEVLLGLKDDIHKDGYNVHQSQIAIGSGGLCGKGFLNGTQTKLKYVPEQETDFIFCTVGEEFGFAGAVAVLTVFLLLILRLVAVAERQTEAFSRIFGYCVVSILLFHVFINIGMVMGLTPVIGIPLPFFSYGGSSLWGFTILLFIFLRLDACRHRYSR